MALDDATEHDEVMFGVIHAIESYDKTFGAEKSFGIMAKTLPDMLVKGKEWAKILHKRILNHDPSRIVYAEVISRMDDNIKRLVLNLIHEVREKNPKKFEGLATDFLSKCK